MIIIKNPITHLAEKGLIPGTKLEYVRSAPLGDPIWFKVRGVAIAVRQKDLDKMVLNVEPSMEDLVLEAQLEILGEIGEELEAEDRLWAQVEEDDLNFATKVEASIARQTLQSINYILSSIRNKLVR